MKITFTKYRNVLVIVSVISLPLLFGNLSSSKYIIKSTGSHPGSTGSPGDLTCAQGTCHNDAPLHTTSTGINTFIFPSNDSTYTPGQTYNITLKVNKTNIKRFGFEINALDNIANESVGTLAISDSVRTQLVYHPVSGNDRYSVTHTINGIAATPSIGQTTWNFNWVAPSTNVGKITFYYATLCTNFNAQKTGDEIFLGKFTIKPSSNNSISEYIDEQGSTIYFDAGNRQIILDYILKQDKQLTIKVTDALGREIINQPAQQKFKGGNTDRVSLENITNGIYIVNLLIEGKTMSKKIIVN